MEKAARTSLDNGEDKKCPKGTRGFEKTTADLSNESRVETEKQIARSGLGNVRRRCRRFRKD